MRVVFTAEFKIMQYVRELYINNRALVCFIFIIQKIHNFCYTHHSYINKMSTQKTAKNIYIHKNIKMKDFYRQTREEVYQHNLKHGGCRNMRAHVRRLHRHNHMVRGFEVGNPPVSYAVWLSHAASQSLGVQICSPDENLQTSEE